MLVDQRTEGVIVPLNAALQCEGRLELANSKLNIRVDTTTMLTTASPLRSFERDGCPWGMLSPIRKFTWSITSYSRLRSSSTA